MCQNLVGFELAQLRRKSLHRHSGDADRSSVKRFLPSTTGIAFVNANAVAVRIKNHRHAANRRWQRFDAELHPVLFQMRNGRVEILHFERGEGNGGIVEKVLPADGEASAFFRVVIR